MLNPQNSSIITLEEYLNLFGINANIPIQQKDYFIKAYNKFIKNQYDHWHWGAFLWSLFGLSYIWFAARRLYLLGAAYILVLTLSLTLVTLVSGLKDMKSLLIMQSIFNGFFALVLGHYGNFIHFFWIQSWRKKYPKFKFQNGPDVSLLGLILGYIAISMLLKLNFILALPIMILLFCIGAHIYWYEKPVKSI